MPSNAPAPHVGGLGGLLMTGYVQKRSTFTRAYKRRFLVLTSHSLHWFKRMSDDDLFGSELGSVVVGEIRGVERWNESDGVEGYFFCISANSPEKMSGIFVRWFSCGSADERDMWVKSLKRCVRAKQKKELNHVYDYQQRQVSPSKQDRRRPFDSINNLLSAKHPCFPLVLLSPTNTVVASSCDGSMPVIHGRYARPLYIKLSEKEPPAKLLFSNGQFALLTFDELREREGEFNVAVSDLPEQIRDDDALSDCLSVLGSITCSAKIHTNPYGDFHTENFRGVVLSSVFGFDGLKIAYTSTTIAFFMLSMIWHLRYIEDCLQSNIVYAKVAAVLAVIVSICIIFGKEFMNGRGEGLSGNFEITIVDLNYRHEEECSVSDDWESDNETATTMDIGEEDDDIDEGLSSEQKRTHRGDISRIPRRFITGTAKDGGLPEAKRRWKSTADWRLRENIDSILFKPFPEFMAIKKAYPQSHFRKTRPVFKDPDSDEKYSHLVYYEKPGKVEMDVLTKIGMKVVQHFVMFTCEWNYTYMSPHERDKVVNVIDVSEVRLTNIRGNTLEFFKFIASLSQDHYPERAAVIIVINAPTWFAMIWRVVKPLINEATQQKIRILNSKETLKGLTEFVPLEEIPDCYGGACKGIFDQPNTTSEFEQGFIEYVERLNSGKPLPRPPHFYRQDVLSSFRDMENVPNFWEGGDDKSAEFLSDLHLPLAEQKSKFALLCQQRAANSTKQANVYSVGRKSSELPEYELQEKKIMEQNEKITESITSRDREGEAWEFSANGSDSPFMTVNQQTPLQNFMGGGGTPPVFNPTKLLHEGWVYKKASGEGYHNVFGRRNWAPRWAKLVETNMPGSKVDVPAIYFFWFEFSTVPSSVFILDGCVCVPVDRREKEFNSFCFDIVHLPATRMGRSLSTMNVHDRDIWVVNVNEAIDSFEMRAERIKGSSSEVNTPPTERQHTAIDGEEGGGMSSRGYHSDEN